MKKKWIAGGIAALVILAAIGIRIYTVNKNVQVTEKQFYEMGDEVDIGDNIFWYGEKANGYSVTVNSAKLMSFNEFVTKHELTNVENIFSGEAGMDQKYPEMIVDVEITIKNSNLVDTGDLTGIMAGEYRLIDGDCRLSRDLRLFALCNPTVGTNPYILLRPDSEMQIVIPFGFSPDDDVWPIPEKRVRNGEFFLAVSLYPVQKNIRVEIE